MKVLILHQHFKLPQHGGAIRSYYLARALVERGGDVAVICAHGEKGYSSDRVDGIDIHYVPVAYDNRFGFYRRVTAFLAFMLKSLRMVSQHADAEVVYAISTPLTTGIAAMIVRWRYKIPYIFEVGDLWPDAPVQMGVVRNPFLRGALYRMEKTIYSHASAIVALSEDIRRAVEKKISAKSIHVLPNMCDTDFFKPGPKLAALEHGFGVSGKFVVSYIGAVGVANGLRHFLECAAATQRQNLALHFLLCGDGAMVEELKSYARKLGLKNLTFIPFQTRDGVGDVMNVTDANFISYLPVEILETGSPNKYFDGLAAGKLTVINFGGWVRAEVESRRCGIYVNPERPGDFAGMIRPFVENAKLLKQYQQSGRQLAESKYARSIIGERYWRIVTGTVS